jgi:hypothetical protein
MCAGKSETASQTWPRGAQTATSKSLTRKRCTAPDNGPPHWSHQQIFNRRPLPLHRPSKHIRYGGDDIAQFQHLPGSIPATRNAASLEPALKPTLFLHSKNFFFGPSSHVAEKPTVHSCQFGGVLPFFYFLFFVSSLILSIFSRIFSPDEPYVDRLLANI